MSNIEKFEDLKIWQEARYLANEIYVHILKKDEIRDYELKNQINRSSGSIMDNIAEGFGRSGNREFIQFLAIAKASCEEVKSQLYRCFDRSYLSKEQFDLLIEKPDSINKMIYGMIKYLRTSDYKGSKFKEELRSYQKHNQEENKNQKTKN